MSEALRRYPGVRSFEESDQVKFFGRAQATEELLLRVLSVKLLLQFAPSGVGKSSLLHAGLFPALREHQFFPCVVRLNRAEESLCEATERSLRLAAEVAGLQRPIIPHGATSLRQLMAGVQLWSADLMLLTPVLTFDQFEEVFTLRDEHFRRDFAMQLGELRLSPALVAASAANDAPSPDCKVILSLREEYLGKLEELSGSIPDLFHERLRLLPLTQANATDAIVKPAQLAGGRWAGPTFGFSRECLESLIDFIDGESETVRLVEPLTLQLVCQQAETIVIERARHVQARVQLELADFGGKEGLEHLVRTYVAAELSKLPDVRTQKRAREMLEYGLLDPNGKRLMLEQDEIRRHFGLEQGDLDSLVAGSLLRREPRNESIFYEISHDRVADSIATKRRLKLPNWVKTAALMVTIVLASAIWAAVQSNQARNQTERALGILLGEDLVSRLRETGLSEALQRVLQDANIDEDTDSLALALSLRHRADVVRERGLIGDAQSLLEQARATLDGMRTTEWEQHEVQAERARVIHRLAQLAVDKLETQKATEMFALSASTWNDVLSVRASNNDKLGAAESLTANACFHYDLGNTDLASTHRRRAQSLSLQVLAATYVSPSEGEHAFELGHAMQIYAGGFLCHARHSAVPAELKSALAMAHESLRLRPASSLARVQVGVTAATYARDLSDSTLTSKLLAESRQQYEALIQFDPENRRMLRERAAVQVVSAETTARCAELPLCKATLSAERIDAAELMTLDALGAFRRLEKLDPENLSLASDVRWALQVHAGLLMARGRTAEAHRVLDSAFALATKLRKPGDVESMSVLHHLWLARAACHLSEGDTEAALAATDSALESLREAKQDKPLLSFLRWSALGRKVSRLKELNRSEAAASLEREQDLLVESMRASLPFERPQQDGLARNNDGVTHFNAANAQRGDEALKDFERAAQAFREAIAIYPFDPQFWLNLHDALISIISLSSTPQAHERALKERLVVAWLFHVLTRDSDPSKAWRKLYEARRDLALFLRLHRRQCTVQPMFERGVLEADAYAREQPDSSDALFLQADANLGVGILRRECQSGGWEEALRKALSYGDQLAAKEPERSERVRWVGDNHALLADYLQQDQRLSESRQEYDLARAACQSAERLASPDDPSQLEAALACLQNVREALEPYK